MPRKFLFYTLSFAAFFLAITQAVPSLEKRDQYSGQATYYTPGLGACGGTSNANSMIAALNKPQWGNPANSNSNSVCGKSVVITGPKGSCTVTIVDLCPECAFGSLDLSPAAFNQIADPAAGRVAITWSFAGEGGPAAAAAPAPSPTPTPTPTPAAVTTTTSSTSTSTSTTTSSTTSSSGSSPTDVASEQGQKVPSVSFPFMDGKMPFMWGATLLDGTNPFDNTQKFVQGNTQS